MICTFHNADGTEREVEVGHRPLPDTYRIPEAVGVAQHWNPSKPDWADPFRYRVYDRRRRQADGAIVYVERTAAQLDASTPTS